MTDSLPNPSALSLVRALKGAPISVLFAMRLAAQPVGEQWLILVTGYSSISVRQALAYLVDLNLIQRNGRYSGWALLASASQLVLEPLPAELPEPNADIPPLVRIPPRALKFNAETPTTATATIEGTEETSSSSSSSTLNFNAENLQALKAAGIGEPTASRLAALPHITPAYVRAHAQKAKAEGISTGLLIHRLRQADPAPEPLDRAAQLERSWGICPRCHRYPCMCSEADS